MNDPRPCDDGADTLAIELHVTQGVGQVIFQRIILSAKVRLTG